MTLAAYRLLSRLLWPVARAYLWRLGRKDPAYRAGMDERWGRGHYALIPRGSIWIHAASVGEVRAAQPLIDRLLEDNWPLYITTNTPTGRETAEARYGPDVRVGFPPVDVPYAVERFLEKLQPSAAVFVELELWPNRLAALARKDVPIALVNARLSDASLRRYARFGRLMKECLKGVVCISAQTEEDGERYRKLGVPDARIQITGNLKFDQSIDDNQIRSGRALRARIGAERPVWVAASIRQAEASIVGDAHERLRERYPNALLIAVPRHPDRFEWPGAESQGLELQVRDRHLLTASALRDDMSVSAKTAVVLGDTFGEMIKFLAAADVAFVGGTLTPVGGHNPLEPAALGKALLMGPHVTNFRQVDALLGDCGGRIRVNNARELAESLISLFGDSHYLSGIGENARGLLERHRGATERTLMALQRTLFTDRRFSTATSDPGSAH